VVCVWGGVCGVCVGVWVFVCVWVCVCVGVVGVRGVFVFVCVCVWVCGCVCGVCVGVCVWCLCGCVWRKCRVLQFKTSGTYEYYLKLKFSPYLSTRNSEG